MMSFTEEEKRDGGLNLKLSFVDRVEEKLTSPEREIISPTRKIPPTTNTGEAVEDVNGNVPQQLAENLDKKFQEEDVGVENILDESDYLNTVLHIREDDSHLQENVDTESDTVVSESFIDRRETYLQIDVDEGNDLDMERQKKKSSEASFQWYEDQNRRDKIFHSKADVDLSQTNTEKERISSQLLDKTKEMYFVDSKKDVHDGSNSMSETPAANVKLYSDLNTDRFEMYNAMNKSSNSKVDETLPEAIHEYGNVTGAVTTLQVDTELSMKSPELNPEQTNSEVSDKATEQKINVISENFVTDGASVSVSSSTELHESQIRLMKNSQSKDTSAMSDKVDLETSTGEEVSQSLIFEEDEENVIIHFGSEFSQDQQEISVTEEVVKQEVQDLKQEMQTEAGQESRLDIELEKAKSKTTSLDKVPPVPTIEVERKFKVSNESRDKLIKLGATLLEEKIFTDRYYDNDKYSLTLSDAWLRQRNASWELKLGRQLSEKVGLSTQYNEISDEKEIAKFLTKHFKVNSSFLDRPLVDLFNEIKLSEFAVFTTTRQSYGLPDCTVDLDLTDFGFQVGEVEVMVMDESHIPAALDTIADIASKLGFQPLQLQKPQI